ncbi:MAG: hypothetical protein ABFC71_02185 [Methanoregula sp.]
MTPSRITLGLVLVIVALLLAAGCAGQPATKTPANSTMSAVSPVPPVVTTAPVTTLMPACPLPATGSYWIAMNPVGAARRGDEIHFSGTTNIPAGKTLNLAVYESAFHPHCKCCFDDFFMSDVKIRKGDECRNVFSLDFDSTNFWPQEYLVSATFTENESVTGNLIFTLQENTTPLSFADAGTGDRDLSGSSFALLPVSDVRKGDVQTIRGVRNGTDYAVIYSIREVGPGSYCSPLSPWCKGGKIYGIINPAMFGPDSTRFVIRFDTGDLEPGQYVVDLDLTCTDAAAQGWFNVTPDIPETTP